MRETHVREFMQATMQTTNLPLQARDSQKVYETLSLEGTLIAEECKETLDEFLALRQLLLDGKEITEESISKLLKELADLQYVISHAAVAFGLPLEEAFRLVHKSNMSKLDENGEPILREDGKVLKGDNYLAPNLSIIVEQYATKIE